MTDQTRLDEIRARVEAATPFAVSEREYLLDLVASLTAERDAEKAAVRKLTDAMDQVVTFLGTVNDAMYECVFCGATKDEEHHRPGCQVDAALATMKARTYSVTAELAALRAVVEEALAYFNRHRLNPTFTGQVVNDMPSRAKIAENIITILNQGLKEVGKNE